MVEPLILLTANLALTNAGTNISSISAGTSGQGDAGSISIDATKSLNLNKGASISSDVFLGAVGNGGALNITTANLTVNQGLISAYTFRQGNAGSISINASESLTLNGGQIFSAVAPNAVGDGGDTNITTDKLTLTNSGGILATSIGEGDAGNISIDAKDIIIDSLGKIDASSGKADANSFGLEGGQGDGTGNAGSIFVKADTLSIDNGQISSGNRPNVSPTANTTSQVGGNINLEIAKNISLSNNSDISARAFNNADGGNINIQTNFLVAFPDGNNDIFAGAEQGKGGNISINAESLFGIEEGPLNDLTNDINASSDFNLDGTININTSDINPVQGATELPSNIVEATQTADQTCSADSEGKATNGLAIAGRGGVTPPPDAPLNSENISNENSAQASISEPIETAQGKIQPARGIKFTKDGRIILTAYRTNNAGERIPEIKNNCGQN
jgi:large exoprotein involved in heme utilization and adhesion